MDCTEIGDEVELLYECYCLGYNGYNNRFCTHQLGSSTNQDYCFFTPYCKDTFGCVGQHHAQCRILNKQYTEAEYKELVPKIIEHMKKTGEWGEFFPIELSPFAYNQSMANTAMPLSKEEALAKGFDWREEDESTTYDGPKYDIPESIDEVSDEICEKILTCEVTGKNYRIVKPELKFYRDMKLPIPRICWEERHQQRARLRNKRDLYDRHCAECDVALQTTCNPSQPEKVLCEACFNNAVN